jgi:putative flavoprotein involved in K+ transport
MAGHFPPSIAQLHSSEYRNPHSLAPGAVLVIGAGQSGSQIAEELYQSGRKVYLSVGRAPHLPRRYRGRDIVWWADRSGFFDRTVDRLPSPRARFAANPQLTGRAGGHTINLHQFARDGVTLLGHVQGVQNGQITLAPDLHETLAAMERSEADELRAFDVYATVNSIDAPEERLPQLDDGYRSANIRELDLEAAGMRPRLIGGADVAVELDARRAIDQGTRVALSL